MSRRFKGRRARAIADPHAEPARPAELDDSNSYADPWQPDRRVPRTLNARRYVTAESHLGLELEERDE